MDPSIAACAYQRIARNRSLHAVRCDGAVAAAVFEGGAVDSRIVMASPCLLLYREDEAKQLLESGTQKMQSFLAENVPGAEITGTENHIDYYPSGPRYLSDYVAGKFRSDEGGEQDFLINAVTGEVYFGLSEEKGNELRDACVSCVAERFGFGNGYETYAGTEGFAWLVLPTLAPGTERRVGHDSFEYTGLPAEAVLSGKSMEEFVREPEGRPLIGLHHWYYLPEGMDLSGIRLEKGTQVFGNYERNEIVENGFTARPYELRVYLFEPDAPKDHYEGLRKA